MPTDNQPTTLADDLRTSLASMQEQAAEPDAEAPEAPSALTETAAEVPEPEDKPAADGRPRREDGTFAPKPKDKVEVAPKKLPETSTKPSLAAVPKPAEGAPEVKLADPPAASAAKAPASWRPEVREKWASLPPDVQAEINRREREGALAIQQAAPHRQEAEGWRQVVAPYEMMFRASGTDARQGVAGVLQMAATLFSGPEPMKAKVLATLVKQYGVTVESLATALDGTPDKAPQTGPRALSEQDVSALVRRTLAQEREKAEQEKWKTEAEGFRNHATYGEFYEDLREEAGLQMAAAAQAGRAMSVEEAFKRASRLHDGVRTTLDGRQAKAEADKRAAEAQKKRAAASTIRSVPASPVGEEGDTDGSVRGDLELMASRMRSGAR